VRQHGQKFVLRRGRRLELRHRVFVLPGAVVLAQQRIPQDLEQAPVQHQAPLRHRRLLPHDFPETVERHAGRSGPALDCRDLRESGERITRDRGAHDLAFEHERSPDDRQAVLLFGEHRGPGKRLLQAAAGALGEQARLEAVFAEQRDERRGMHRAQHHLSVEAEQLHRQPGRLGVPVQRRLPQIGAEEARVHPAAYSSFSGAAGGGARRSGPREIRP